MWCGYDIFGGFSCFVLQMVCVCEFMMFLGDWIIDQIKDEICFYEDDMLGKVMGVMDVEQLEGVVVCQRGGEDFVIGWIIKVDVQVVYVKVLVEISEEEYCQL